MEYLRLIKILWKKEGRHYSRLWKLNKRIHNIIGKAVAWPMICISVTFFHYCFAIMHFLFETFLYIFKRGQFRVNMTNLEKSL